MPNVYEGDLIGEGLTFGIVVSRFNSFITEKLLAGALDALKRHGVDPDTVDVFWTPGALKFPESPNALRKVKSTMPCSVSAQSSEARPLTSIMLQPKVRRGFPIYQPTPVSLSSTASSPQTQ